MCSLYISKCVQYEIYILSKGNRYTHTHTYTHLYKYICVHFFGGILFPLNFFMPKSQTYISKNTPLIN